jgi:hypothetical protein
MIDEQILLDIVNDFEENPKHKFSIKEFKHFTGPKNEETLFVTLMLEEMSYDKITFHITLSKIKRRLLNLLSLNRVILNCDLKTESF